jgi:hypothetical protein
VYPVVVALRSENRTAQLLLLRCTSPPPAANSESLDAELVIAAARLAWKRKEATEREPRSAALGVVYASAQHGPRTRAVSKFFSPQLSQSRAHGISVQPAHYTGPTHKPHQGKSQSSFAMNNQAWTERKVFGGL